MSYLVYVGTYTEGRAGGIHAFQFDAKAGRFTRTLPVTPAQNPSYLAVSGRFLYAVAETETFGGRPGGAVAAYAADGKTGALSLLNMQLTQGRAPCHVATDAAGRFLFAANYNEGTVTVFPLHADGSVGLVSAILRHAGACPVLDRQAGPHAHFAALTPDGKRLCAADLGCDRVFVYPFDPASGVSPAGRSEVALRPGAGPRHIAFHPSGRFAYVVTELSNEVAAFSHSGGGRFENIQYISTLPEGYSGQSWCAAVHLSPDGRFLYASNREHDSIAVFAVDPENGTLERVQVAPSGGRWPREFMIDPTGKWMVAANQKSDHLKVFHIEKGTGKIEETGETAEAPCPACVVFAES
jgi:6-phosphogluconolactonase